MTTPDSQAADGLAFATPGDWIPVRVPREAADAASLASQLVAVRPELASRRDAVDRMLHSLVEACAALDVLCAYTTALDVRGGPLPVTLLVSVHLLGSSTVDRLAADMATVPGSVASPEVGWFDLPAGNTARIERLQEQAIPGRDGRLVSLVVQYLTEMPGTDSAIILTFATPAVALANQLRQLFHQIVCTLRFEGPDHSTARSDGRDGYR